MVNILNI